MDIFIAASVLGGIGLLLGGALAYASIIFKIDYDERIPMVVEVLPGANCGGCGYAGCDAFAKAVVDDGADMSGCPVGGAAVAAKISEIMGVEPGEFTRRVAYVRCKGTSEVAEDKYVYSGTIDCISASKLAGGPKSCPYGCLGFGTCVRDCKFNAISIVNGIAVVDREKCTDCRKCISACPKGIIINMPYDSTVTVGCTSCEKGAQTKKSCSVGCIGCKLCEKACMYDAITVENNLAIINYEKCTSCGKCVEKCPQKIILMR